MSQTREPVQLVCPHCQGAISLSTTYAVCASCARSYPVLLGIPDLRIPCESWIDYVADTHLAQKLADRYHKSTFEELIQALWSSRASIPQEIVERRLRGIQQAADKYEQELAEGGWIGKLRKEHALSRCLEIGAGTGGFVEAASKRFQTAAIDVSLALLITAKKRLEERGSSCTLVCACVERLPFRPGEFDLVAAFDVIEHVGNREVLVDEADRILKPSGLLLCTTPNRYSLSAEPHVGLWGVGMLPRKWMKAYVHWRNGMPYDYVYPLSISNVRSLMRQKYDCRVTAPPLHSDDIASFSPLKRLAAGAYQYLLHSSLFRALILPVAPFFHVVARKREDGAIAR